MPPRPRRLRTLGRDRPLEFRDVKPRRELPFGAFFFIGVRAGVESRGRYGYDLVVRQGLERETGFEPATSTLAREDKLMPTLSQFTLEFQAFNANRLAPSTAAQYDSVIRLHLLPTLGDRPLHLITTREVIDLQSSLAHWPARANKATMVLLRMLRVARLIGHKTQAVERPRSFKERQRTRYLSHAERTALLHVLDKEPSLAAVVVKLLLLTGLRRGEALSLRWCEIDLDRGLASLEKTKTGPSVRPLSKGALDLLTQVPRVNEWVFPGSAGHYTFLGRFWKRVRAEAGLPDVRLHDLRHDFASRAVSAGVPLYTVSRLLGHSNPNMTARYAHLSPDTLREAAERANG